MMNRFGVYFIIAASAADAVLTDIGIRMHQVTEGNPLMAYWYHSSPAMFYGIKLLLPLALLYMYPRVMNRMMIRRMIGGASLLYGNVLALHCLWIASLFITFKW